MRPDGCLEYHGRKDFEVKVRGYRIDVSEIEIALLDHLAIKEAAVVARQDHSDDTRLIAYVVPAVEPTPTVTELRRFVQEKLPDYMTPSVFVLLATLGVC